MRQANSLELTMKKLLIEHSHHFKARPVALCVFVGSRREFFIFSLYICTSTMTGLTADSPLHLKLTTSNLCFVLRSVRSNLISNFCIPGCLTATLVLDVQLKSTLKSIKLNIN